MAASDLIDLSGFRQVNQMADAPRQSEALSDEALGEAGVPAILSIA